MNKEPNSKRDSKQEGIESNLNDNEITTLHLLELLSAKDMQAKQGSKGKLSEDCFGCFKTLDSRKK